MQLSSILTCLAVLITTSLQAQSRLVQHKQPQVKTAPSVTTAKLPEFSITRSEVEAHVRFLASDELEGRRTGERGNWTAARYIAEQFRLLGLKPAADQTDYFQRVNFEKVKAATSAVMYVGKDTLQLSKELVVMTGGPTDISGEIIYAGYGLTDGDDGYKGRDVKGRIVVVQGGSPDAKGPGEIFRASRDKRKLATEKGVAALIELYSESIPWGLVNQYFSSEQITLPAASAVSKPITHLWLNNANNQYKQLKEAGKTITLRTSGRPKTSAPSANVAGIIEGTDPRLKNEYVILSAHFDHVGIGKQGGPYQPSDSIFNGARDNAMGVTAILEAAKALSQQRPSRSVLILAFTGEEVGLLGSQYYAEHPLVPLKQTIFALDTDGAGYSDTTIVSVIGLERTGAKAEIEAGAKAFGLSVFAEPAPEQGLFDRSDNVNFAIKGVPAPDFSPGFKSFDQEIAKYYHQAIDNPESLNFNYVLRYCQAYAHTARLIANRATRPQWSTGDKYEPAAKALYGQE